MNFDFPEPLGPFRIQFELIESSPSVSDPADPKDNLEVGK